MTPQCVVLGTPMWELGDHPVRSVQARCRCSQGVSRDGQGGLRGEVEESQEGECPEPTPLTSALFPFVSVQDFLDKAKKEFEENWSKNPKVSLTQFPSVCAALATFSLTSLMHACYI